MIRIWKRVKFLFNLKRSLPFLKDFFLSNEISRLKKVISVSFVLAYLLIPFDLIPDFLTVLGIVDDVTIFTLVFQQIVKMAPQTLREKHGL
ncbi:YkvA family protein [Thalassobacillus pellis]|uniref:YkvA family protein n=1 Tax=Thalassobacillus pellis TaxID=748008 RepID=UPI001EF84818|nr:DUF1232 domain-containing protein [Thalassobacillus pellis]MBM7554333.1 uncharacterized membrane protein YkvA (DUF1232 family) [Thalassobacillus pellis]